MRTKNRSMLFETLVEMRRAEGISFHVPGHKFGRTLTDALKLENMRFENLDYTEIKGTDNLHAPEGIIAEAQKYAASVFGALDTHFLVGGTTSGLLGALLGTVARGGKLIAPRDAHRSVHSAVLLGGIEPIYVVPHLDSETGISLGMSSIEAAHAMTAHPDAKALLVTYPTYVGAACDLKKIIQMAHDHEILVIVDEAHAAHFGLSDQLPDTALSLGADLAVQSTHKTLTALTQSSMLHYGTKRGLDLKPRISAYLSMIQSSSPSYPQMVSLELAARFYELEGADSMKKLIERVDQFQFEAKALGYDWIQDEILWPEGYQFDRTRILLSGRKFGLDGYALMEILESNEVYPEYATSSHVVLIPSLVSDSKDFEILTRVLSHTAETYKFEKNQKNLEPKPLRIPQESIRAVSSEVALWSEKEMIPIEESQGRISGDFLIPYPPGIPLLVPGEVVTEEVIRIVRTELGIHHKIHGLSSGMMTVIKPSNDAK